MGRPAIYTDEQRAAKRKAYYTKWQAENGAARNKARREAYAKDAKVRKRARESAQRYREKGTGPSPIRRYREINGKTVEVFSTGGVAHKIGRSTQVLRNWEYKGWIPKPTIDAPHRLYTLQQLKYIRIFSNYRRGESNTDVSNNVMVKRVYDNWEK